MALPEREEPRLDRSGTPPKRAWLLIAIAALAVGLGGSTPVDVATSASASASDQPAGKKCVSAEEAKARAAGDGAGSGNEGRDADDGAAPKFTAAFSARTFTLNASLDGMDGKQLPISIEEVCDIPKALTKQAVQLPGTDAIALLSTRTSVWLDGKPLHGTAAVTALDGADTAVLRVRLAPQSHWGEGEDGDKVPTFTARRITVTD
jgi:hypothetical protein